MQGYQVIACNTRVKTPRINQLTTGRNKGTVLNNSEQILNPDVVLKQYLLTCWLNHTNSHNTMMS